MFRIHLLLLLFLLNICFANGAGKIQEGKKFTTYTVQAKDTWTRLSVKYGISIAELQEANPGVTVLKIGATVNVPAGTVKQVNTQSVKNIYHTVQKGETLYRISKIYNQSIADIKKWNNLTSDNVGLGSTLIVGKMNATAEPTAVKQETPMPSTQPAKTEDPATPPVQVEKKVAKSEVITEEDPALKGEIIRPVNDSSRKEITTDSSVDKITETGVATWLNDADLNQNKFYALHRTAPIGTIIKVTNRMNNNSVFVKVVGVLPDTGENENIIIKITQAAAQRIGAIDQRFTAELSYGLSH